MICFLVMRNLVVHINQKGEEAMSILIYGGLILLGFVLGYFFQTGILITISAVVAIVVIWWLYRAREIKVLAAMLAAVFGGVSILAMWATWYFVNDKVFVQDFLRHHILR